MSIDLENVVDTIFKMVNGLPTTLYSTSDTDPGGKYSSMVMQMLSFGDYIGRIETFLDQFKNDFLEKASTNSTPVHVMWLICYRVMTMDYIPANTKLKVANLMHRMLLARKCHAFMIIHVVDVIMAYETTTCAHECESFEVRRELMKCLEVLENQLRNFSDSAWCACIFESTLLEWADRSITFILKQKEFSCATANFAAACLFLLHNAVEENAGFAETYGDLAVKAHEFLKRLFRNTKERNHQKAIQDTLGFLIFVEEKYWPSDHHETIIKMYTPVKEVKLSETSIQLFNNLSMVVQSVSSLRFALARQIVVSIFPRHDYVIWLIKESRKVINSYDVLNPLVVIVANSVLCDELDRQALVAYLSIPWIIEDRGIDWKRYAQSNELMVDVKEILFRTFIQNMGISKKESLRAISLLKYKDEWRKSIFASALNDYHLSKNALDYFPMLVKTINSSSAKSSIDSLVKHLLQLKMDIGHVESGHCADFLRALRNCICALDVSTEVENRIICKICTGSGDNDNMRNLDLHLPEQFFTMMSEALRNVNVAMDVKTEVAQLLYVMLKHRFNLNSANYHSMVCASFSLLEIANNDDLFDAYLVCLAEIVSMIELPNSALDDLRSIMMKLEFGPLHSTEAVCAQNSRNVLFADSCFVEHIGLSVLRRCTGMVDSSRHIVEVFAKRENISTRRLFKRRAPFVCSELIDTFLKHLNESRSVESLSDEQVCELIDLYFIAASEIFVYRNVKNFMDDAYKHLCGCLFTSPEQFRTEAILILQQITIIKDMAYVDLVDSSFPIIWGKVVAKQPDAINSREDWENVEGFVESVTHCKLKFFIKQRIPACVDQMIYNLSVCESFCKMELWKLSTMHGFNMKSYSLTEHLRENYLGTLLKYRHALLGDEYYSMRPVLLKSLSIMMGWLERDFMDKTALRMIMVLRAATKIGELSVPVWHTFVKCLSPTTLVKVLPQIFISSSPVLHYESAKDMLEYVRNTLMTNTLTPQESARIERLAAVLHNSDKVQVNEYLPGNVGQLDYSKLLSCCTLCLLEEGTEVAELVLTKLLKVLKPEPLEDEISAKLIEALLYTMRTNSDQKLHRLVCQCLGRIGAVDPGKIADRMTRWKQEKNKMHFKIDNTFYAILLTKCAKLHLECSNSTFVDCISLAIQQILKELTKEAKDMEGIEKEIKPEYVADIAPLKTSNFRMTQLPNPSSKRPAVTAPFVKGYDEWVSQWFAICAANVMDDHMSNLYMILRYIVSTGAADVHFGLFAICHVMIHLLTEGSEIVIIECVKEMTAVLQLAYEREGWLLKAAHVVFAVIDTAELYLSFRSQLLTEQGKLASTDQAYKCVSVFINSMMCVTVGEDLLAVLVARSCHCPTRALKWLEHYCINTDNIGVWDCSRVHFLTLEKIYAELDNTDAVLGAFESIEKRWQTSPEEGIIAFEATGDYNESLSLYNSKSLSLPLIKSLIRLNKPEIAWNNSVALKSSGADTPTLRSYQIEAAWRLSNWSEVEKLVDEMESQNDIVQTWGSSAALIFNAIRSKDHAKVETEIELARDHLVSSMTAMTMEESDTYSQCYKYISQLSILAEYEDAINSLELLKAKNYMLDEGNLSKILAGWKKRSENAMSVVGIQEPMLTVRRSLLEHSNARPKISRPAIGGLLLQSSRLARQAGHHQVSWTFLVEAKRIGMCEVDVAVEESRYLFDKGEVSRAVTVLENAVSRVMPNEVGAFEECLRVSSKRWSDVIAEREISQTSLNSFLKAKLLLCDYIQRGGESSLDDLYRTYVFISRFSDHSEDLCYRVAIFLDSYVYAKNEVLNSQQILEVLNAYSSVLSKGKSHLFHVMPRILTVWLDSGLEVTSQKDARSGRITQLYVNASNYNKVITDLFSKSNHFMFYTAFAQLISRITHPNETVYCVLKDILASLVAEYPYQCLWKCASLMRSAKNKDGHNRCMEVLALAKTKVPSIDKIIRQYNYIAKEFLKACNKELLPKREKKGSFAAIFPQIPRFFTDGTMHDERNENQLRGRPKILLPFTEHLEKELETPVHTLTQAPESACNELEDFPESVYIDSVLDEFSVMASIAQPKRCVLRGSDGNEYPILLKPKDELRKDSRVMDFARMVNALLMQNSESRRKHLSIKTYTVVPLQEQSGLIEWVPDLMTFRAAITPLMNMNLEMVGYASNINDKLIKRLSENLPEDDKLKTLLAIYERCPVVMSEWFRRQFQIPSQWYAARTAFTTSTAVMTMVGFILGLGDRHPDNILLNTMTGQIVHVDYNMLFNKAEELRVPEIVPFRLTRNVIDGFGPTGVEGVYRKSCETTMSVLREKKDMLLTVLATFLHDPLMEWGTQRSQQQKENKGQLVNSAPHALANEVTNMVEDRLSGKIVSPKIFTSMLTNVPMSVQGQVSKLINISKDDRKLSKMYIGWSPQL